MSIYIPFVILHIFLSTLINWKFLVPTFIIGTLVAWYFSDKVMCRYNYRVKFYKKAKKIFEKFPEKRNPRILEQIQDSLCGMEVSKQLEEEFYIGGYKLNERFLNEIINFLVNIGYDPIIKYGLINCGDFKIKMWTPRKFSFRVLNKMKKDIRGKNERLCSFND